MFLFCSFCSNRMLSSLALSLCLSLEIGGHFLIKIHPLSFSYILKELGHEDKVENVSQLRHLSNHLA